MLPPRRADPFGAPHVNDPISGDAGRREFGGLERYARERLDGITPQAFHVQSHRLASRSFAASSCHSYDQTALNAPNRKDPSERFGVEAAPGSGVLVSRRCLQGCVPETTNACGRAAATVNVT